ncbi:hypothetical protein JTE90_024486 [Oedothorax gibbosus]|uniref:Uncharacterized protein n=1 Tax=Oedothorax gibbosus TaxID=931172 RepID=A0AAV6TLJ3_9ARAC|nr:hypothetical protein JTE90_024486 [Oedothorax gibbosus]
MQYIKTYKKQAKYRSEHRNNKKFKKVQKRPQGGRSILAQDILVAQVKGKSTESQGRDVAQKSLGGHQRVTPWTEAKHQSVAPRITREQGHTGRKHPRQSMRGLRRRPGKIDTRSRRSST